MLRDVVFDFFGTLVEYRADKLVDPDERRAHAVLAASGIELTFEDFRARLYRAFEGHEREARRTLREPHMHEIARGFLSAAAGREAPADLVEEFSRVFCEEWGSTATPVDGLEELLAGLSTRFRLSVVSNTFYPPLVHDTLQRLGIRDRFATVRTSAELGIRKPDGRIFEDVLVALGARADEAVYVGDSYEADYLGASAAGIRAILIDPAGKHAVRERDRIRHLTELPGALER
jgi:putative hydrolase of the HAD superfamily